LYAIPQQELGGITGFDTKNDELRNITGCGFNLAKPSPLNKLELSPITIRIDYKSVF